MFKKRERLNREKEEMLKNILKYTITVLEIDEAKPLRVERRIKNIKYQGGAISNEGNQEQMSYSRLRNHITGHHL